MSMATVPAYGPFYVIFPAPLHSHCTLPLSLLKKTKTQRRGVGFHTTVADRENIPIMESLKNCRNFVHMGLSEVGGREDLLEKFSIPFSFLKQVKQERRIL
jgi:hypothetical protein